MKKRFFLASMIVLFGLTVFLISCSKDEESKSCTCTETDSEGYSTTRNIDPSSYGVSNCSDLELKLRQAAYQSGYDSYFSCR